MAAAVVLKSSRARSVRLERDPASGAEVVVKRFHHPDAFGARRDRRRARQEQAMLERAAEAGARVPRPLGVARVDGGWEVRLEAVPGARGLEQALDGLARGDPARARLATALGRELAALHAAGIDHPDLHPGNALVDADGAPWLIDFHHARRRRLPARAAIERDLRFLAAAGRELFTRGERLRLVLAWRDALPPRLARRFPRARLRRTLARAEREAPGLRRRLVERGLGRWVRDSGVVGIEPVGDGRLLLRRDLAADRADALRAAARDGVAPNAPFVVVAGTDAREHWLRAARLHDHRVPAPAPAGWFDAARGWVALEPGPAPDPALLADRRLVD